MTLGVDLGRLAALCAAGTSFAVVTVVARKAPVSAHLGDTAIVFEDGRIEGYIGGGCSREILRSQALAALQTGEPRLIRISPDALSSLPGYPSDGESDHYVRVRMTCASQGALDLYINPYTARPLLVVAGATPIALAVAKLGKFLDLDVRVTCDPAEADRVLAEDFVCLAPDQLDAFLRSRSDRSHGGRVIGVVASMGEYDDTVLEAMLSANADYVALVASRERCAAVLVELRGRGLSDSQLSTVRNPAGLDIHAKTASEVALSIVAEIVQSTRERTSAGDVDAATYAIDPICGMTVATLRSAYTVITEEVTHHFCSVGCKREFVKTGVPEKSQG